jgi:hypothetical protein
VPRGDESSARNAATSSNCRYRRPECYAAFGERLEYSRTFPYLDIQRRSTLTTAIVLSRPIRL